MTIGNRIKSRRKELNLSVDEVAEKLNKNRATIYRYENDEIENINKKNDIIPKYVALRSEGQWVIGYGLDNQFFDRNLPYIVYRTDIGDNNE